MIMKLNIKNGSLWHGDCLELMRDIPSGSIDMILCDLPYGTTQNKWDTVIPFEPLWIEYWRIAKHNTPIVLTAAQPFTSALVMSQINYFKYDWVWDKCNPTGFGNAKKQPLRYHESVLVFYKYQCVYNPIKWVGKVNNKQGSKNTKLYSENYNGGFKRGEDDNSGMKYPKSIFQFQKHSSQSKLHPTQKPVALFEYLIKTYTNPGDKVLDNCIGSGTTAVACENTDRKWIGIEKNMDYFLASWERINSL